MIETKSHAKNLFKKIFKQIPILKNHFQKHEALVKAYAERYDDIGFPPGHYYSPIPSITEINENAISNQRNEIRDIDLNTGEQFNLLQQLQQYYSSIPYSFNPEKEKINNADNDALRYKADGAWYRYSDVIFLVMMMMHYKPKRIIEIGSGHSSAVMLDTNEFLLGNQTKFTFVEPYPEERLLKLLKDGDKRNVTIIKAKAQHSDIHLLESLEENDILFIDSTHVSKAGSDVNHIFFNLLPVLKPGVLIHFHDIYYPFELPQHWLTEKKWFWNEIYLLRAFLMNNHDYKIVLFNSMLQKNYREWFEEEMPACLIGNEDTGSIWIQKIR